MRPPTRPSHTRLSCELKGAEIILSEEGKKKKYCSSRFGKKPVACCNPESPWGALAGHWGGGRAREGGSLAQPARPSPRALRAPGGPARGLRRPVTRSPRSAPPKPPTESSRGGRGRALLEASFPSSDIGGPGLARQMDLE